MAGFERSLEASAHRGRPIAACLVLAALTVAGCGGEVASTAGTPSGATGSSPAPPARAGGLLYYAKADAASADNAKVIANSHVSGALFQVVWSEVEGQDGVLDWSALDVWMKPWLDARKQVAIRILWSTSGYWPQPYYKTPTPAWVWERGAAHVLHAPSGTEIPLAWDPVYQRYAWRFMAALAARYEATPGLAFVDVTPGAETNPYRLGTIDERDPAFRSVFLAAPASDGRVYSEETWQATVSEWIEVADRTFARAPLLITLNQGGFGESRLRAFGQIGVDAGFLVGQNGLKGSSYPDPANSPFFGWSQTTRLFFETATAVDGSTGNLMDVVRAAERIRCSWLNLYPEDVRRGTRGEAGFDPAYEAALEYGAQVVPPR